MLLQTFNGRKKEDPNDLPSQLRTSSSRRKIRVAEGWVKGGSRERDG